MNNKLLGSCPHCGTRVWTSDFVHSTVEMRDGEWVYVPLYRCIGCKLIWQFDEMVPF